MLMCVLKGRNIHACSNAEFTTWLSYTDNSRTELVKKMWVELENKIRVELFQSFNRTYHVTTQLPSSFIQTQSQVHEAYQLTEKSD